jgi:hypothetical protein
MKSRVTLYANGTTWRESTGRVVLVPKKFSELLQRATQKLSLTSAATRLFNRHGGEIDAIELIQNDDVLFVSCGEDFLDISGAARMEPVVASNHFSPKLMRRLRRCSSPVLVNADVGEESAIVSSIVTNTLIVPEDEPVSTNTSPLVAVTMPTPVTARTIAPPAQQQQPQSAVLHDQWVRLNVGGRIFHDDTQHIDAQWKQYALVHVWQRVELGHRRDWRLSDRSLARVLCAAAQLFALRSFGARSWRQRRQRARGGAFLWPRRARAAARAARASGRSRYGVVHAQGVCEHAAQLEPSQPAACARPQL